jgi:hypothetical protein
MLGIKSDQQDMAKQPRAPWSKPVLRRMIAGKAENSNDDLDDGTLGLS